jgi:hypothetical protein
MTVFHERPDVADLKSRIGVKQSARGGVFTPGPFGWSERIAASTKPIMQCELSSGQSFARTVVRVDRTGKGRGAGDFRLCPTWIMRACGLPHEGEGIVNHLGTP